MMDVWIDIACIVFVAVTMNHLGLVKAVEDTIGIRLRILNCPKCATWWATHGYLVYVTQDIILSLAISFLASYTALWLELLEGFIDTLYNKVYEKIYPTGDDADSPADIASDSPGSVS